MAERKAFIHLLSTNWGKDYIQHRDFEDQITFGLYEEDGSSEKGEIIVRWYQEMRGLIPKLTVSGDMFGELHRFQDVFQALEGQMDIQPDPFRRVLLKIGYEDISQVMN